MTAGANALLRAIEILELFHVEEPVWTIEQIASRLGVSIRTVYRDVRTLRDAGFLDPTASAGYGLGPAFVHFDRLLRQSDVLIGTASGHMRALLEATRQDATVVLCRRYKDCVMCIHQEHGNAPHSAPVYERGVTIPLFAGATSKVVLAHLTGRGLKRIYLEHETEIKAASSGLDWKLFSAQLAQIRADGYALTIAELRAGSVGIASPILLDDQVVGSVGLVFDNSADGSDARYDRLAEQILTCAKSISADLANADGRTASIARFS